MADVAGPVLASYFGLDVLPRARRCVAQFHESCTRSAGNVEHFAGGLRHLQCKAACARHVIHTDEVTLLQTVFVY